MERKDIPIFSITLSVNELKEITKLCDTRNEVLRKRLEEFQYFPHLSVSQREEINAEVNLISSVLDKFNDEVDRVANIVERMKEEDKF